MGNSRRGNKKIGVNPHCVRISHIDRIRTAFIMYKDIPIGTITEEYSSLNGDFDWVIRPIYKNFGICKERYGEIVDIGGIDVGLNRDEYIRNYVPHFVTQRTIPEGREDLFPLLCAIQLTWNDLFEVMCRTHAICGNDDYYVSRTPDLVISVNAMAYEKIEDIPDWDTDSYGWIINGVKNKGPKGKTADWIDVKYR